MNRGFFRGFLLGISLPFDLMIYVLEKVVDNSDKYPEGESDYFREDLGTMLGAVLVAYLFGALLLWLAGVIRFG